MSATVTLFPSPARQERISSRIYLVGPIARKLHRNLPKWIQLADLEAEGLFALVRLEDLKPSAPDIYAACAIKGAMRDLVRIRYREARKLDTQGCSRKASHVGEMLEFLPDRQRRVIKLRLEGHTQREIGVTLGVSQQAAAKVEIQAIERLRAVYSPSLSRAA